MRSGSQRVHACQTCRRRKIKCDNKRPACSQCIRQKKKCPGPTEGLIFIHSVNDSQPQQQRQLVRYHWNDQQATIPRIPIAISSGAHEVMSRLAIEIGSYHLSPWTPHPWFMSIPRLALSADFQSRMLLPFQAMKVAFRALPENDASLKVAAYRYYSSGLERHQAQLHQLVPCQKHQHLDSILNLLLMSMALLEFEMMAPLATDSWFPHAYGALGLLEQVGPQGCQESPFFEIFWQLRFFMSYVALSTRKLSFLGSQAWLEIPFQHHCKTEFDYVIDTHLLEDNQFIKGEIFNLKTSELRQMGDRHLGHAPGAELKFAYASQTANFERIVQVLVTVRELVSACASNTGPERQESLSTAILEDSKHLMNQPSLPFNVGLQVTAAASLVAQYASNSIQKEEAARLYTDWHGRFVLKE
ncbi:hypothetical protein V8C42DRAFT_15528 [Trichoderma barbatum]